MKKLQKGKYYRLDYSDYYDNYIIAKFKSEDIYFHWQIPYFKKWKKWGRLDYNGYSVTRGCRIRLATGREIMQIKALLMIKDGRLR